MTRKIRWHQGARNDLLSVKTSHRTKIRVAISEYLTQVPLHGENKHLDLGAPWGAVNQLSFEDYRVFYDILEQGELVGVLVVFEKPSHLDTETALKKWLGEAFTTRRKIQ